MKHIGKWFEEKPVRCTIIFSFAAYLLMEICSRHSVIQALWYLIRRPHLFFFNVLIIEVTVAIGMFFKKRVFVTSLILLLWIVLGAVNGIMLTFRTTPFSFNDLKVVSSVFTIISIYMEVWQIVLVGVAAILLIVGLVFIYRKSPKWKRRIVRGSVTVASGGVLIAYLSFLYVTNGIIAKNVYNIADAYKDYGFVTCFSQSIFVRGVDKPDTYSVRTVRDIADMLDLEEETEAVNTPNVIFLQLESFFDPEHLTDVKYSSNPVPFYQQLKETCTTGYLSVPSFGAGTANTEFEVLTGMSLDYFGPGEYPFSTILRQTTCESIAYNLGELGYISHMIHNNSGSFYGRNVVYPNLGFNTFSSLEYMNDVKVNPLGWAKDEVLTQQILDNLESTESQDLIYTISVQGHGKYPEEEVDEYMSVEIADPADWSQEEITSFTYYINQIHQMDIFLKDLVQALEDYGEPTVLVAYGDHLPDFDFTAEEMDNSSLYQTEYVIWSNFEMEREVKDLETYQLSAYVLGRLGMHNGILTRLHQLGESDPTYQEDLKMLEYDMLYGDQTIYSGVSPYETSDMQMGTQEIVIDDVSWNPETRTLTVKGDHFTEWSRVYVNNEEQKTVFVTPKTLQVENIEIYNEDTVMVAQQTNDKEILSSTLVYYILDLEEQEE